AGQNPTSGALAARRVHRLRSGDTLQALAWAEYGDAAAWRVIADINGIDDPLRLAEGRELLLPSADELDTVAEAASYGPGAGRSDA
uniref:LysM peptidoglycan-binding domain-containing protein n=1 Tax=Streptomyces lushanensis TaxID=1434255 RepID=UPI00114CD597